MSIRRILLGAFAALSLAACGPMALLGSIPTPSSQTVDVAMETATKALISAENAYAAVALSTAAAVRQGIIPTEWIPKIRELNTQIGEALDKGHNARTAAERLRQADLVKALTASLSALKGETP